VLFDERSAAALCVIDLDTVMPGLLLHDVGDLIRSTAGLGAEDEPDPRGVAVSVPRYAAVTRGFLDEAHHLVSGEERAHFAAAAQIVTLEQAARFLADHLLGDRYYRVERPAHNLDRARAQLALYRSLKREEASLRTLP